jgi:colanic acid/amylovoran biosynthesis glycosyltransferase
MRWGRSHALKEKEGAETMRIALIVGSFPTLSETFILNQITGLIDCGHEVEIFANGKQKNPKVHPDVKKYDLLSRSHYRHMPSNKVWRVVKAMWLVLGNLHRNPVAILKALNVRKYRRKALSLELLYATIQFLDKGPYDVIHCHFGPNGNLGVLLREIGAIRGKVVTTFHGYDMSTYVRKQGNGVYNFLFEKGDLFLPISERWKERLMQLGCDERRIVVHRMGIDTAKFKFSPRQGHKGDIELLTVARLVEKKGVEYAIRAVARALKKHPNIVYKIAGDGPLKGKLESLVEELGIKKSVKFLRWQQQQEIMELMQKGDLLLAPSVTSKEGDQEGIPVTLMEALARGLPVLSTRHSGISEVVQDGESGFLVPERDVDGLAERLEYLIEHPEIWPEMGRAGRRFVEEHYDIDKLNDRLVEIYQKLLSGELP